MFGRLRRQPLDLVLDIQHIGIGLDDDARRHEAALGDQLECMAIAFTMIFVTGSVAEV